jgi:hypothetical protein
MIQLGRGIKAGLLAAMVFLVIAAVIELTGISDRCWDILWAAGIDLSGPRGIMRLDIMVQTIIFRIVGGIVFGAVLAAFYDYLPRGASILKAVLLSLFLWIVSIVGLMYIHAGWPALDGGVGGLTAWGGAVLVGSIDMTLVGIASTLVFGAVVGAIWIGMRGKEVVERRRGMVVLLTSFIWGVVQWVGVALPTIIIGYREAPFPFLDGDWWSILAALTVFLGLAGWILVLLAWRRTKRGESGFKPGVVGGVCMVPTGFLLLPGVLSIIGGVLSRREPADRSGTAARAQ